MFKQGVVLKKLCTTTFNGNQLPFYTKIDKVHRSSISSQFLRVRRFKPIFNNNKAVETLRQQDNDFQTSVRASQINEDS